jgi:hypothetical protein
VSCASRKVTIAKEDTKITLDSSIVTKVDGTYVKEDNVLVNETVEEVEYKPIDSLKPMVIDGKQYINTIIKSKKQKIIKVDKTKVAIKVSSVKKLNVKREEKKKVVNKKVDKKANYWMYLWFLIPVIIIVILERYGKMVFRLGR